MDTRLQRVRKLLHDNNVDALLITNVANITYLTNFANFSPIEREGYVVITKTTNYLITDGRYITAVKDTVKNFDFLEIAAPTPLKKIVEDLIQTHAITTLGIEESDLFVSEYKMLKKYCKVLQAVHTSLLRRIKEPKEISRLEKACQLGDEAFKNVLPKIQTGITELELAFEIEMLIKKNGADISFTPIVAFGKNAAIPHHHTGHTKLKMNEFVLLDFGVKLDMYCSDMTRTVFFGKATPEQKKIYQTVADAQQKAVNHITSTLLAGESSDLSTNTVKAFDVDTIAREYIISQGYPSIPHALGHGIGLEVHESPTLSPRSKDTLTNGMVFSIEPGIYLPHQMGVRIEDLYVIEHNKIKQITNAQKHLIEI